MFNLNFSYLVLNPAPRMRYATNNNEKAGIFERPKYGYFQFACQKQ